MICPECGKKLTDEDAYGHDCEVSKSLKEARAFAELKRKEDRFGYLVVCDLIKDENGCDEWVETKKEVVL